MSSPAACRHVLCFCSCVCKFMPKINYGPALSCPASSVSDHHSAQIGDIEAFMAVWCPRVPPPPVSGYFSPPKGSWCPWSSMWKGCPNVSFGSDYDLRL